MPGESYRRHVSLSAHADDFIRSELETVRARAQLVELGQGTAPRICGRWSVRIEEQRKLIQKFRRKMN